MVSPTQPIDWNHLRAFLATAEQGSLSAAARHLNLTQPTLGRQVSALETELGVLLFERVGRNLVLTSAGADLLVHARSMGQAAERATLTASGLTQSIDGLIRITASDVISSILLPPALRQLRQLAPKLNIDIVASNDIRDLMKREADIAIRHVRPEQPDLIARLVREAEGDLYAATDYLDRMGRVTKMSELKHHDFISFGDSAQMLQILTPMGFPIDADNFRLGSKNGNVAWEMVRQGLGIAPMMRDVAVNFPDVERVLPEMEPMRFPIWLVTHRELHTSPRIRLVFDFLVDFLSKPKTVQTR